MKEIVKLKLIQNKRNKAVSMQFPKRKLSKDINSKLTRFKNVKIKIEGFE